ncbi:MAG: aldo/keto reductase [Clostridiales bacterium]|nr:aldo/keto reductase [Clostridiales bacterium]
MEYTELGKSGITVSRICLGCMGFGDANLGHHAWTLDEEHSKEIIRAALDNGINFFDTAMGYAGGTSEEYLGRIIKGLTARKNAVIATKFLPRTQDEIAGGISGQKHVADCLDKSLKRLETDYVDLYICHMWDYHTPIEEIMEGLNTAVKDGKARAIGISNCYAWQLEKANAIAERNGWAKFVSVQGHYNLLFREEEREMIPCCEENGIALTPYSSLASGRLVKPADEMTKRLETDGVAKSKYDSTKEQDGIIIARVAELAEKKNLTRTQVALGWLLSKVTAPIVGATKIRHIEDAVAAVGVKLTAEEIDYLEESYVPHKLVGVMQFNHK